MRSTPRWYCLPLLLLAFAAAAFPALLIARPVQAAAAPAPAPGVAAPQLAFSAPSPPRPRDAASQLMFDNELQNLALSVATGFAGGFTLFLCISGWGLFRMSLSRDGAVAAMLFSTAGSFAGFALGMAGFIRVVGP